MITDEIGNSNVLTFEARFLSEGREQNLISFEQFFGLTE